jgi:hypothetical protein
VAKLCALRKKDQNFVRGLVAAKLVDPHLIVERLASVPEDHSDVAARAADWVLGLG